MYRYQLPLSLHKDTIKRKCAWLDKFFAFAADMYRQQGLPYNTREAIADDELAEMFISEVAAEDKGKTRPASARAAINTKRAILSLPKLPVGGAITNTCTAALRNEAATIKQTLSIHVDRIRQIVTTYGTSPRWDRRMLSLITALGFAALLRLIEVRSIRKLHVKLVLHSFHEVSPCFTLDNVHFHVAHSLPRLTDVRAILVCIGPRKTTKKHGSWITISDPTVCSMLIVHLHYLRAVEHTGKFLFPSRKSKGSGWVPHPCNPINRVSYVALIRLALHDVCGIPWDVCLGYTGHLLRVGGNNFILQTKGLSEDVNRQLGDWCSTVSCRSYNQLDLIQRLNIVDRIRL